MHLFRGLHTVPSNFAGCVASIGNFDGLHLGHQTIANSVKAEAARLGVPSLVVMFEPQPKEFFALDKAPARIANLREKLQDLTSCGVEYVLCLPFNSALRSLSAADFVQNVLLKALKVKHLIIGDDFRFGHDRSGDYQTLVAAGVQYGFSVQDTKTVCVGQERISSTKVREALAQGNLSLAAELLGRPYRMSGRIGFGRQLGRTLNTPTANVMVKRHKLPLTGVFAVQVINEDNGDSYHGVASVGIKPTITAVPEPSLEVHVLNFSGNLYHQHLTVTFVHKIRDEQKFAGLDELQAAIEADKNSARKWLQA